MLEAEITSTGDVMVEGQHVGHLNGFRFTPDPQAAGEAAKALNAAAQKALSSEIEGRATRVHEAVDEAFVLANDGLIRWLGEPVGRITAGAHGLEPQVRVIADEQLSGPALDMVRRRLDLWLAQHVKKLLGALVDLEKAEGLDGIAKGIAFQIAESLGVLERGRVAEEVKTLPQEARASLRKMGVRFGAYHLYLPALVKPAPRALAAQLWALKNGGVEGVKGLDEVPHLAASGRTSFVADPAVQKGFYRAAGFRVCGERAVRVDILERLADLIRPAIAYRPGTTPGDPPPGAADNDGFVVTVGMTSLAGCSGEAFGSILRSLGYVVDRRPGPAITVALVPKAATEPVRPGKPVAETAAVVEAAEPESVAKEQESEDHAAPAAEPVAGHIEPEPEPTPMPTISREQQSELIAAALEGGALEAIAPLPTPPEPVADSTPVIEVPEVVEAVPAGLEPSPTASAAVEPPVAEAEAVAEAAEPEAAIPEAAIPEAAIPEVLEASAAEPSAEPAEAVAAEAVSQETPADATPVEVPLIDVWRPHRQNVHNRRPPADRGKVQGRRDRAPPSQTGAPPVAAAVVEAVPDEPARATNRPERSARYRRPEGESFGRPGGGGDRPKGGEPRGEPRSGEPRGGAGQGRPQGDPRRARDGDRDQGGNRFRREDRAPTSPSTEKPKSRDRAPDPNSPFAKLAILKEQMEKDRR